MVTLRRHAWRCRSAGWAERAGPTLLPGILPGKREQVPPDAADAVPAAVQQDVAGQPAMGQRRDAPGSPEGEVPDPRSDPRGEGGDGCRLGTARPGGHDASLFNPRERGQALNLGLRSPVPWVPSLSAAANLRARARPTSLPPWPDLDNTGA